MPFPDTWISSACGIEPPPNWINDVPGNTVAFIHSHPFHEGEDTRPVCGEVHGVKSFGTGLEGFVVNRDDWKFLNAISTAVGKDVTGYVMDGMRIKRFDVVSNEEMNIQPHNRCGY